MLGLRKWPGSQCWLQPSALPSLGYSKGYQAHFCPSHQWNLSLQVLTLAGTLHREKHTRHTVSQQMLLSKHSHISHFPSQLPAFWLLRGVSVPILLFTLTQNQIRNRVFLSPFISLNSILKNEISIFLIWWVVEYYKNSTTSLHDFDWETDTFFACLYSPPLGGGRAVPLGHMVGKWFLVRPRQKSQTLVFRLVRSVLFLFPCLSPIFPRHRLITT